MAKKPTTKTSSQKRLPPFTPLNGLPRALPFDMESITEGQRKRNSFEWKQLENIAIAAGKAAGKIADNYKEGKYDVKSEKEEISMRLSPIADFLSGLIANLE